MILKDIEEEERLNPKKIRKRTHSSKGAYSSKRGHLRRRSVLTLTKHGREHRNQWWI
jgi:hypothetical protein